MAAPASPRHSFGVQSRLVRWLIVGAGIISVLGIAAVSYAGYRHAHEGDRVQRASARLSAPAGWKLVDVQKESGSPFLRPVVSSFILRLHALFA
jgi:hypothetical protein